MGSWFQEVRVLTVVRPGASSRGISCDPAIAVWRSGVIAAGGCDALLRSLCGRLAPQRATARPAVARVCEPRTDLLSLMAAYRAVWARRQLSGEAGSASSDAR